MPTATNGRSAAATPACAETAAMHSWLKAAPLAAVWDLVLGTGHQFWFILDPRSLSIDVSLYFVLLGITICQDSTIETPLAVVSKLPLR
jgi:hypothetical protein